MMGATRRPEEPSLAAGFPALDFDEFHRRELPGRLARFGALALPAARRLGGLAFRLPDDRAFATVPESSGLRVVAGDAAARTVVGLDHDAWEGLMHDLESAPGLLYAGRARRIRGDLMDFVRWEPALRAMLHGIPVYDPERLDLRDRAGRPLDPARSFAPDASREEMAHFLRSAGYLLVKGVFAAEEIAALRDAAEELRARAVEGDGLSWWARDRAGRSVLCRVIHAGALPVFRRLHADPRIAALVALAGERLAPRPAARPNGITVLWKNPQVDEGLSDLPWHRDCGMGGHAVMCPILVASVYLWDASREAGELRFLPGSWRTTCGFAEATDERAPQGVAIPAETGDVSLHFGDGMHCAPPPTGRSGPFRTSVLIGFVRPGARHHRGEDHYNDVLLRRSDGQVEHLAKVATRG
jgi:ectoine hydroxylase-related dioxygenase (phytanoyl-CoA dioxygenase family)